jgi:hypothetical protein
MGLFDFLKPKKPHEAFMEKPIVREGMLFMELENLQKHVSNLCAVGRDEDAKRVIGEFINKYGRNPIYAPCTEKELTQLCYSASYMYLPGLVFGHWNQFMQLWNNKFPFSAHLAFTVSTRMHKSLTTEQVNQFKSMQGSVGDDIHCYVIQYPTPPPEEGELDLKAINDMLEGKGDRSKMPFYGPYYVAVSYRPSTDQRWFHVLGQSPGGGTDIRTVSSAGSSWHSGVGPDPSSPKDFLRAIQPLLT